jgi:hypothetical protein
MPTLPSRKIARGKPQRNRLTGLQRRKYLYKSFGRKCAYCSRCGRPLQADHMKAKGCGGTSRLSNRAPVCERCNQAKGKRPIAEFLAHDPELLRKIIARVKPQLASAPRIIAPTSALLLLLLRARGLPVKTAIAGHTKSNCTRFCLRRRPALDAACIGEVETLHGSSTAVLTIRSMGRGTRKRTQLTSDGFPRGYLDPHKKHFRFRTGDIVLANVTAGKKTGRYVGRVVVTKTGSFKVQTRSGTVKNISHRYCVILQRGDGYAYYPET